LKHGSSSSPHAPLSLILVYVNFADLLKLN
jgi:hypothetical protein